MPQSFEVVPKELNAFAQALIIGVLLLLSGCTPMALRSGEFRCIGARFDYVVVEPTSITLYGRSQCNRNGLEEPVAVSLARPLSPPRQDFGRTICEARSVPFSPAERPTNAIKIGDQSVTGERISIALASYEAWSVFLDDQNTHGCVTLRTEPRTGRSWWGYPAIVAKLPFTLVADLCIAIALPIELLFDPPKKAPGL